jgi:uncharacterized protein
MMKIPLLVRIDPKNVPLEVPIKSFPLKEVFHWEFDQSSLLGQEIVTQMNEEILTPEDRAEHLSQIDLKLSLEISRHYSLEYQDYFLLIGQVEIHYPVSCVRCLKIFPLVFNSEFNQVLLIESKENDEIYGDQIQIVVEHELRDLYFYSSPNLKILDSILELIHLQKIQFPVHQEDCQGLCQTCGIDRNHKDCGHGAMNHKLQ